MAEPIHTRLTKFAHGVGVRQIRIGCGLVLFAYLVSHFLNHALGNISMDALATGVHYHTLFWQFPPVGIMFYAAALVHSGLGVWALYARRQFRWKAIEPLQLVLGLSIPALIIAHIAGVRLGQALYGQQKLYPQVFYAYWIVWPYKMWLMYAVLLIAWVHGCIGLYFWLRMKAFYKRAAPFLLAAAVLIPTVAMLGLYQGGRAVVDDSDSAEWQAANLSQRQVGTTAQQDVLEDIVDYFLIGYLGLIGLVLLARGVRAMVERRGGMISLSYGNGRTVRVPRGLSVLEASLRYQVPHASVCGGRARCSTCRIRVIGDCTALPEPSKREAFVLNRVGATDPSIRLACQLRPTADLSFFQLFMPHAMSANAHASQPHRIGQERYLVSMFVDMRGSTKLAEHRLPFDTVFIVNRFLGAVSQAVIACGGQPNQFVGDGQLALFGLQTSPQTACRQALRAAAMIAVNIDELNQFLAHDLREPIRFGIGIHGGEVIIGDIGYRDHMVFTALGDAVNVAARLQDMTKNLACEAVLSEEVRITAGLAAESLPRQEVAIRGRNEPMIVRSVTDARTLAALVDSVEVAAA
ncbi:MAG: adenylate/guanylate cyclase domain-containing protein [Bradyrhizobium sp.]|uniref:adenylate/guanylate cyclase domain-containing protein n=1 Tax=Bradyrhizobium sp. TaxID=376 RepID=UPI001212E9D1|nr:adenylate/guanylate cyclase domain-containing protein [Bradyrhizobium sp.]THD71341.1 MAG: adenylate/guanylate cyclase domain-containing protein [Bradyrhizobium sp.]